MRLSKIKLAGFKSFVDPTTITFPSNLIGIVGPNGCGKSNVIDAVRWVMGESSAKHLRGDSMADVIFNGSSARKPVGTATIELVFDNSDGTVGGQYASYAEIAIRRVVARDGTSSFFLNGTRCRRRDIVDIFLGTGLGSRSYSIIEQGMISRLVEAKPEQLRVYLEEAAGISKYKERRHETEIRIRHTRENISRLDDLRGEVEKQLQHLQRQARTAKRYKGLKDGERKVKAELVALKWQRLDHEVGQEDRRVAEKQNQLEGAVAEQRAVEATIEKTREQHSEANDSFNAVQGRFYGIGADIARVEQAIQHAKDLRSRQEKDLADAEQSHAEISGHIKRDRAQLAEIEDSLSDLEPQLTSLHKAEKTSSERLAAAEERMQAWNSNWDDFNSAASETAQNAEVERTQIDYLQRRVHQATARLEKLREERAALSSDELEAEIDRLGEQGSESSQERNRLQKALGEANLELGNLRSDEQRLVGSVHSARENIAAVRGRLGSLEALQQSALGKSKSEVNDWLRTRKLDTLPRLAEQVVVESGWEAALETVLGFHLEAVCVEQLDKFTAELEKLSAGTLTLVETGGSEEAGAAKENSLQAKVKSSAPVAGFLLGIIAVDDLVDAVRMRNKLGVGESVITRNGIWMGPNWVRVNREEDARKGVLAREQEIKQVNESLVVVQSEADDMARQLDETRARIKSQEKRRDELQEKVNFAHQASANLNAKLDTSRSRLDQMVERAFEIDQELEDLREELVNAETEIQDAKTRLDQAERSLETAEIRRESLVEERDDMRTELEEVRCEAKEDREKVHDVALKVESKRSLRESTQNGMERMVGQLAQLEERCVELRRNITESESPLKEYKTEQDALLKKSSEVEKELKAARHLLEEIDTKLRNLEQERVEKEKLVQELRGLLEEIKLNSQEIRVRRETLKENLSELNFTLSHLLEQLEEGATQETWEEKLASVTRRIERLGAINLAAIEEFSETSERKQYLDAQRGDLIEALTILENAIRKIDRETRTRFKETFDKVNTGLQESFPRLFGGGHAYLELTGEDLLDAGVTVMARPPGKRNSTIQLLSGGEKALTAVALVFALFQLNPAPFCLLDEVDAPLDDANVERFCALVKEMSERTQFVIITHNKTTMEMTSQLTGVTMSEPGVSRLVAVDVDEAVQMAAM